MEIWEMILLATLLLVTYWIYRIILPNDFTRKINGFAGPPRRPIIGNAYLFKFNPADFLEQVFGFTEFFREDKAIRLWVGPEAIVALFTPEYMEKILSSSKLITKSFLYRFIEPWLAKGLLTSTGEKWHKRRKLLTPTFHLSILNDFLPIFTDHSQTMVRLVGEREEEGKAFNIFPYITLCAMDSICETAMGVQIDSQHNADSEYVKAVYAASETVFNRARFPWLWPDVLYNMLPQGKKHHKALHTLHSFTDKVIKQRRDHVSDDDTNDDDSFVMLGGKRRRLAFLDMLLAARGDDGKPLSLLDVREEVDTFMFEGHDTTAAACSWAVHLLGANPEAQRKVHEELDAVFEGSNREASMEDLRKLTYLDCCIKEALRLFPSVPFFGRECTEDCVLDAESGLTIPKGATVLMLPFAMHRHPDLFPNPEHFLPERFSGEGAHLRSPHPFSYVPFSAGPRNCIGQKYAMLELKVMLSLLFRRFRIISTQEREELRPMGELITRPEHGIYVKMEVR